MKAKSFFTSLRKVIREEVQRAVRIEIQNVINGNVKPVNKLPKKRPKTRELSLTEEVRASLGNGSSVVQASEPEVEYSSNPMINGILNETAREYSQPKPAQQEEYPTMGGSALNTGDLASMLGYGDMQPPQPTVQDMVPKGMNPAGVTDDVANALTRDYSQLMKAIDKKKGIK